jgi:outer membrane immunogenic protein
MTTKILACALLCVLPASAFAADIPARFPSKAPVMLAPVFSWTGFYIGLHAGYGWGEHDTELLTQNHKSDGFMGGGQIGYNWQFNNIVLGVEADISYSDIKSNDTVFFALGGATSTTTIQHQLDYFATFRGRLGMAFGPVLPYITAGAAYGSMESSATAVNAGFPPGFNGAFAGSDSQGHWGWVAGGGLEYAFAPNLSAKVEYLYADLGSKTYLALPQLDPTPRTHDLVVQTVRVGLNYRFGGPGLGAARY